MTDPNQPEPPAGDPPGSVRMGREALSKVFRSDGGSELSSHHNTRLVAPEAESRRGPRLTNEIVDAAGAADARDIGATAQGPAQTLTLNDNQGPADFQQMLDAEGPSDLREMHDAIGPVIARKRLEDHYWRENRGTPDESPGSEPRAGIMQEADSPGTAPTMLRVDTFSIHMEDRLARVKASQRETLEMIRQLLPEPAAADVLRDEIRRDTMAERTASVVTEPSPATSSVTSSALAAGERADRLILMRENIHTSLHATVALHHRDIVEEVMQALARHPVVVIGMRGNPFVHRARRLLTSAGIEHGYLGYGSYLSGWRRRNALKMWSGWPTFPMVFVRGILIGGFNDLRALSESGELASLLQA